MPQLIIDIGDTGYDATFQLDPLSKRWLVEIHPELRLGPSVTLGFKERRGWSAYDEQGWLQVAKLLTNLSEKQLAGLGGFRIEHPLTKDAVRRALLPVSGGKDGQE
ncbi:MAG: hypothetical protein O3A00_28235, partial [Planctomycetota bacterium]|nr:hypothetical protein [Planctomycetota bacterium]